MNASTQSFTDKTSQLFALAALWARQAKSRFDSAKHEADPVGKRVLENGAMIHFNLAEELSKVLTGGAGEYSIEMFHGHSFEQRVRSWITTCFGHEIAGHRKVRAHRFLEEALELAQATDCTEQEVQQLVDYVYSRPVGDPQQEVGGVMLTLAGLCGAYGISMSHAAEAELARVWANMERIRAKQAAKPEFSALPAQLPREARLLDSPGDEVRVSFFIDRETLERIAAISGDSIACMSHVQHALEALLLLGLERKEDELRNQIPLFDPNHSF